MQTLEIPVTVSGKNIAVTPALEAHAHEKVRKALRMFDEHPSVRADVVLHVGKQGQTAEVTAVAGGYFLRGESTTSDMYHSINQAVGRIEGQLRKFKAKLDRKMQIVGKPWESLAHPGPDTNSNEEAPRIVRTKRFVLKPMDTEEALLQMELLGHDFFVFTRADTFEVNVLYRRKDGNYGLMEPIVG